MAGFEPRLQKAQTHLGELLRSGRAQHVGDQLQLVHHVAPGEQRLARNDLHQPTASA